jgi:hypothetical protein
MLMVQKVALNFAAFAVQRGEAMKLVKPEGIELQTLD